MLLRACADAAYNMAFSWHREFADRLEQMVGGAIASLGLPYAREMVDRLRRHIDDVLAPGVEMKNFREGDLVCVHGNVLDQGRASHFLGGAPYRVDAIQLVERSDP